MPSSIRFLILLFSVFTLVSCNKSLKQTDLPASIQLGDRYFTRFVIRYEKDVHKTTNYRRGFSIPINTEVTLLEMTDQTILVKQVQSGQELLIKNVEKHTHDTITQAFDKLFSKSRIGLTPFSKLEREHINNGTVAARMTKKAVLAAIGYPPQIATMNLDSNQWIYWSSRFNKFIVHFDKGKVVRIQD